MDKSNAFNWETYDVPRPEGTGEDGKEIETFRIRHMKAGRTGARKTWDTAPVLLKYLTLHDGLQSLEEKNIEEGGDVLDMTLNNGSACSDNKMLRSTYDEPCNILELGGGSGYVSVGLALMQLTLSHSNMKIMCTDMDRGTIKNMRHNTHENKVNKTVAIENLEWGDDIGGETFAKAIQRKFSPTREKRSLAEDDSDPVQLLTHVIASDVHYGETTLEPLSSIISQIKLRNPKCDVIMMLEERSHSSVAELVAQIEMKLNDEKNVNVPEHDDFTVHVRNVIQTGVPELKMKLIEC